MHASFGLSTSPPSSPLLQAYNFRPGRSDISNNVSRIEHHDHRTTVPRLSLPTIGAPPAAAQRRPVGARQVGRTFWPNKIIQVHSQVATRHVARANDRPLKDNSVNTSSPTHYILRGPTKITSHAYTAIQAHVHTELRSYSKMHENA